MISYLFTNDLRISTLAESIQNAAKLIMADRVPSAAADKSANNNINTLAFYFNLRKGTNTLVSAAHGDIRKVVINFIQKFQFPNMRTRESYEIAKQENISFAPMRTILKLLYVAYVNDGSLAFVTREEIREFLFFNSAVAQRKVPNIIEVYGQIREYRRTGIKPSTIVPFNERNWKQEDRQLREMTKVLKWAGCTRETDDGKFYLDTESLTEEQKADLFSVMTYTEYWDEKNDQYETYMDIEYVPEEPKKTENEEILTTMIDRKPRENTIHHLNSILYGAPGTGKTYSTAEYAVAICESRSVRSGQLSMKERALLMNKYDNLVSSGRVVFTTFHQSYGYEDFIQGLRPDTKSDTMIFRPVDGVFKKIADRAMVDEENNYVIIIDEINRGNISKIFGELITLIEDDKRWGEANQLSVVLPSGQPFAVPNNLYIIGTMNSADKSISLIDTALRRRFYFIEKAPDYSVIENATLKDVLVKLNQYIKAELRSTDLLIGHAFFIGKTESDLVGIMNGQIIPLLYEYFYDDEARVKRALDCLEGTNVTIDTEYQGRVRVK